MSYHHNPYHLTHVITKHAVQMRHFEMSNGVSPETHFQEKPSPEVWLLQAIAHGLPAVCTPCVPPDTISHKPTMISSR